MPPRSRDHQALGIAFRKARQTRGLTQVELAKKADLPPTYISDIERGVRNPAYEALRQLSGALGVSLAEIVRQAEEAPGRQRLR